MTPGILSNDGGRSGEFQWEFDFIGSIQNIPLPCYNFSYSPQSNHPHSPRLIPSLTMTQDPSILSGSSIYPLFPLKTQWSVIPCGEAFHAPSTLDKHIYPNFSQHSRNDNSKLMAPHHSLLTSGNRFFPISLLEFFMFLNNLKAFVLPFQPWFKTIP